MKQIRLVGYSGGAAIAAILAATRDDVSDLRSVAENLNIEMFVRQHRVTPLHGSFNPIDFANRLIDVPQLHFVAENDDIITPSVTHSYISHLMKYDADLKCIKVQAVSDTTHTTGWESHWRQISGLTVAFQ